MIGHIKSVWSYRYFWFSLVKLDLRNRYRHSFLGIGWSLLQPLMMTVVFCVVFKKLGDGTGWRSYAPYLLCGMCIWDYIRNSVIGGSTSLIQNEPYIRQVPLPYTIYTLRAVLGNATHFLIGLVVVILLIAVLQGNANSLKVSWSIIPGLILATAFSWGIGTVAAFFTVFFRDVKHVIEVGSQVFYFLTPILYYRKSVLDDSGLGFIADLNPVNTYLELIRTPLIEGTVPSPGMYLYGFGTAVVAVLLGAGTTAWLRQRVIFHL